MSTEKYKQKQKVGLWQRLSSGSLKDQVIVSQVLLMSTFVSILNTYSQVFGAFAGDPDAKDAFGTEGCKVMGNFIKVRYEWFTFYIDRFPDETFIFVP